MLQAGTDCNEDTKKLADPLVSCLFLVGLDA